MKKIYSLQYNLLTGSIYFSNEIIDNEKFYYNPITPDDPYLTIFIPGINENLVKDAFLNSLVYFTDARLTLETCMKTESFDFSEKQYFQIKKESEYAIEHFFLELKELIASKI